MTHETETTEPPTWRMIACTVMRHDRGVGEREDDAGREGEHDEPGMEGAARARPRGPERGPVCSCVRRSSHAASVYAGARRSSGVSRRRSAGPRLG